MLIASYPAFVLGYTGAHVVQSELPGGKNGPLDAYRHTLASAVVAYTLSPVAVYWTTRVMESGDKDANRMDRHNNRIGAAIGAQAVRFDEIEPSVLAHVLQGSVGANDSQMTTWLPASDWRAARFW
ncbi:hypothetical protein DBV14_23175 [Variovorax sp. KBW07]|nr:hypothetical protein DBV14_23175 [Variovorax sp. KBW07]